MNYWPRAKKGFMYGWSMIGFYRGVENYNQNYIQDYNCLSILPKDDYRRKLYFNENEPYSFSLCMSSGCIGCLQYWFLFPFYICYEVGNFTVFFGIIK